MKGPYFEFWSVKKGSEVSYQSYTNVKMVRKGSRDEPNRYGKLIGRRLCEEFALWYKNRENCCVYIATALFNEGYAVILKIMDVREVKIGSQCKQNAHSYDAASRKAPGVSQS